MKAVDGEVAGDRARMKSERAEQVQTDEAVTILSDRLGGKTDQR